MLILSIDSAGSACGVCVWRDGVVLSHAFEIMQRGQDARLMPMVVDVVAQAGVTFSDFDKIAVTRGPGSFTGIRVGLAAARGIGIAAHKPVVGVNRFALYHARHVDTDKNLLVVLESKRVELFCQYFPATGAAHEPCLMSEQQIAEFLAAHPDTLTVGDSKAAVTDVTADCAALAASADSQHPDFAPRPLYLRAPDVHLPTGKTGAAMAL